MTKSAAPRVNGPVPVTYHQFHLRSLETMDYEFPETSNGLADVVGAGADRAVVITTGVAGGTVDVTVEILNGPPTEIDIDGWDDIVEISAPRADNELEVAALGDDVETLFPVLNPQHMQSTRIRVHVRGRDLNPDLVASTPDECYLLQAWPAAADTPESIIKATDEYGKTRRTT